MDGTLGGRYASAEALADMIEEAWEGPRAHRFVVLTGGEPLLQVDVALLDALHARGFEIALETNGTIELPGAFDWVCVSPKTQDPLKIQAGHELKLVYPQPALPPESFAGLDFRRFSLQPMDGAEVAANTEQAIAYCLAPSAMAAQHADPQTVGYPLMWELTKSFRFDASHTLQREIDTAPSKRIHGHSYRAEVTLAGKADAATGMVIDFGLFERTLAAARDGLDHHMLDDVPDLGPATMENLSPPGSGGGCRRSPKAW